MKIALGNLGWITQALKTSLEYLGIEVIIPPANKEQLLKIGQSNLTSGLCYPLKTTLGNFLSVKESQPEAVLFYSGCDLCNLPPANFLFKEILNDQGWYPDIYFCAIDSKKNLIYSYFNVLQKISNKSLHKKLLSMYSGALKYEIFHLADQVFYNIRPSFKDNRECESLYESYINKIIQLSSISDLKKLNIELCELYNDYASDTRFLRIGLIGDSYSLMEPSSHNYIDKFLGRSGVIINKWSYDYLLNPKIQQDNNVSGSFNRIFKKNLGVYTSLEIKKISKYINNGYGGLIFISLFNCNPNEILRNLLKRVRDEFHIPIFDILIDEHSTDTGANTRIEAFIDMLSVRKNPQKFVNYPVRFRKFSLARFLFSPLY